MTGGVVRRGARPSWDGRRPPRHMLIVEEALCELPY